MKYEMHFLIKEGCVQLRSIQVESRWWGNNRMKINDAVCNAHCALYVTHMVYSELFKDNSFEKKLYLI